MNEFLKTLGETNSSITLLRNKLNRPERLKENKDRLTFFQLK